MSSATVAVRCQYCEWTGRRAFHPDLAALGRWAHGFCPRCRYPLRPQFRRRQDGRLWYGGKWRTPEQIEAIRERTRQRNRSVRARKKDRPPRTAA